MLRVFISDGYPSALWTSCIAKIGERDPAWARGIYNLIKFIGRKGSFGNFFFQGFEDCAGNRCRFVPAQFGD